MLSLAYQKKSFFIVAIGGDHGMDAGIDLSIMIVVGLFMRGFRFGTEGYLVIGEIIIETIFGEVIHGTIVLYTIMTFKGTGGLGITPIIGINHSTVSLRTIMTGGRIALLQRNQGQAVQERLKKVELRPLKESLKKVDLQLAKENLEQVDPLLAKESLEQVGKAPREPKHPLRTNIAQAKPLKVKILKIQKERNEV